MDEQITKAHFDQQFENLARAVKGGFDAVDERFDAVDDRFTGIEKDIAHIKGRLSAVEKEILVLSTNMVTKQYLDTKIDRIIDIQYKDTLFKKRLLLILEEAKVLTPDARAKLEHLIPAITLNE